MRFTDRRDAGQQLADAVRGLDLDRPVLLALPRGGVPLAVEIGAVLDVPVEVFVARKVAAPGHPEFGIGAVAEGTDRLLLTEAAQRFQLSDDELRSMAQTERREVDRRIEHYRNGRALPDLRDRDVVVVDDGLATGVTAEAALRSLVDHGPHRLVLAVPVCASDSADRLGRIAQVVCLHRPEQFRAVGLWYDDFGQVTDEEVLDLLERHGAGVR